MSIKPNKKPPLQGIAAEDIAEGLKFKFYHGRFNQLPEFDELEPKRTGVVPRIDLETVRGDREDEFAISLDGLLKVEHDGLYRVTLLSDDGSRLFLHGDLFIDHDGNHPPTPASRLVRVKAGLHPIRIEQFEGSGGQELELTLERLNVKPDEQSDVSFFHRK